MLAATIDLLDETTATDRRADARMRIEQASTVRDHQGGPRDVMVDDLSRTGFRCFSAQPLPVGALVRLGLAGAGVASARVTRREGKAHGCEFETPLTPAQLESAFTASNAVRATVGSAGNDQGASHDNWPGAVRAAIFVGGGAAAWAAVVALVKAFG